MPYWFSLWRKKEKNTRRKKILEAIHTNDQHYIINNKANNKLRIRSKRKHLYMQGNVVQTLLACKHIIK